MAEPLDYETPQPPDNRRSFWPRGREAATLAGTLGAYFISVFGSGWLRDDGWPLWASCLFFAAIGGAVGFTVERMLRR